MAERTHGSRRVPLGEIDSSRSRHMWTRSSVHLTADLVIAGQWDGRLTAFDRDRDSLDPRWGVTHPGHPVTLGSLEDELVVGSRGEDGTIAAYDLATGERRWAYETATDIGPPAKDGIFALPYVVALETDPDRGAVYAAARRYERDGADRRWHSTVFAFDADGRVRWRYETDASPIAIDVNEAGDRLAVGYNRCMGSHDVGLVVLDTDSGETRWDWDPGTDGDRRVGDVSFDGPHLAVASHGDKRGYLLGPGGEERWRLDLAVETELGDETLYAYPNHASALDGRVAFATGNTYAKQSRDTDSLHPNEHQLTVVDAAGDPLWTASLDGFAHELTTAGDTLVVPCAQHFRTRDSAAHGVRRFDAENGPLEDVPTDGIATAVAADERTIVAIEEPVAYHDETQVRGEYALHTFPIDR
nr:PQQ-binding-like beta-propeller repeat protein [Natrialba asiatica]